MREDKEDWAGDPPRRGSWWAMLLLKVKVLECWCCPRHANRECCAVLAMPLLVVMVQTCWYRPRHADRECCTVLARLRLVTMVLVC